MAQGLQCEAKSGGWSTRGVRWRHGEQAPQHHLAHAGEAGIYINHALDELLQHCYLVTRHSVLALGVPGCQPHWGPGLELRGSIPCGVTGLCDIEPPLLPSLHGLHEGALGPSDVGQFAHHSATTIRVLAVHHLWLHVEDLEP